MYYTYYMRMYVSPRTGAAACEAGRTPWVALRSVFIISNRKISN